MITALFSIWWAWIVAALIFGLIEILAPSFFFLGFSIGAVVMAAIVALVPGLSVPVMLALFAGTSLIGWIGLKVAFKRQSSGARIVTKDINDNT